MPLTLNPRDYGVNDIQELARVVGTLRGETIKGGPAAKALVLDIARNRVDDPKFAKFNTTTDPDIEGGGHTYKGVAAQLADPSQFSTWYDTAKTSGAFNNARAAHNDVIDIHYNPDLWDRLPADRRQQIDDSLTAMRGVLVTGDLKGVSQGAKFYSTGGPGMKPARISEHNALGMTEAPELFGHKYYTGDPQSTRAIRDAVRNFDYDGAVSRVRASSPMLPGASPSIGFEPGGMGLAPFRDLPTRGSDAAPAGIGQMYGPEPLPPVPNATPPRLASLAANLEAGGADQWMPSDNRGVQGPIYDRTITPENAARYAGGNGLVEAASGGQGSAPVPIEFSAGGPKAGLPAWAIGLGIGHRGMGASGAWPEGRGFYQGPPFEAGHATGNGGLIQFLDRYDAGQVPSGLGGGDNTAFGARNDGPTFGDPVPALYGYPGSTQPASYMEGAWAPRGLPPGATLEQAGVMPLGERNAGLNTFAATEQGFIPDPNAGLALPEGVVPNAPAAFNPQRFGHPDWQITGPNPDDGAVVTASPEDIQRLADLGGGTIPTAPRTEPSSADVYRLADVGNGPPGSEWGPDYRFSGAFNPPPPDPNQMVIGDGPRPELAGTFDRYRFDPARFGDLGTAPHQPAPPVYDPADINRFGDVGNFSIAAPETAQVPLPPPRPADLAVAPPDTYRVQRGDNLWGIADRTLGEGGRYREIAEANNIRNPNLIFPGQELAIPQPAQAFRPSEAFTGYGQQGGDIARIEGYGSAPNQFSLTPVVDFLGMYAPQDMMGRDFNIGNAGWPAMPQAGVSGGLSGFGLQGPVSQPGPSFSARYEAGGGFAPTSPTLGDFGAQETGMRVMPSDLGGLADSGRFTGLELTVGGPRSNADTGVLGGSMLFGPSPSFAAPMPAPSYTMAPGTEGLGLSPSMIPNQLTPRGTTTQGELVNGLTGFSNRVNEQVARDFAGREAALNANNANIGNPTAPIVQAGPTRLSPILVASPIAVQQQQQQQFNNNIFNALNSSVYGGGGSGWTSAF